MESFIKNKEIISISVPNIRTGDDGYLWGKSANVSNILRQGKMLADFSEDAIVAERWICSDEVSFLRNIFDKYPEEIFGVRHLERYGPYLGTIMKLIDTANEKNKGSLSLQVHPAPGYESLPAKPEAWLSFSDTSKIYLGFNKNVTCDEVKAAIRENTIFDLLNKVDLKEGDKAFVPGGIVHAIRYDSFLAEWSKAPSSEDILKGDLKKATSTLADNTDGRQARPGKVNIEESFKIIQHAEGFSKVNVQELCYPNNIIYSDEKGNVITRIFETSEIIVDEIHVKDKVKLEKLDRISCFFVFSGVLKNLSSEFVSPIYIKELMLENGQEEITRVFRWYKP